MNPDGAAQDREALWNAVKAAESVIADVMAMARGRPSKEALGQAIEAYMARYGEPVFRVSCPRCGATVFEAPLFYVAARGNWSWMPPLYYAARFNEEDSVRRCPGCGRNIARVDLASSS